MQLLFEWFRCGALQVTEKAKTIMQQPLRDWKKASINGGVNNRQ